MHSSPVKPPVAIVLCTYNGARYINDQIDSLLKQSWPVAIRVFDDVSTDATVKLIETYTDRIDITIEVNQQNLGYVANFELGIISVLKENFDYIALCDQDDIWDSERIAEGMRAIQLAEKQYGSQSAVLTHSDLRLIDENKQCVHSSFFKYRHYEISNERNLATVLGQNGVMGNTILMNRALATMAQPFPQALHVHDYWLAVLAEIHGHRILLNQTLVDYRIHDANASNSVGSIKFGLARVFDGKSWNGFVQRDFRLPFKEDVRLNVVDALLDSSKALPKLNDNQKQLLSTFRNYLVFSDNRFTLLLSTMKAGFFRQGIRHRLRLAFSILFTKRY